MVRSRADIPSGPVAFLVSRVESFLSTDSSSILAKWKILDVNSSE